MIYEEMSLHERLTNLLMEAGCTVNKLAIDELVKYIVDMQVGIVEDVEKHLVRGKEIIKRQLP